ncbi:substrate-binding domain-containing protein [Schumannella luteola]|uniref:DNA-binding LacI/PurR family transcriptional regulator n=1 Tax=Schumannella luteola TaxID=472059 RepID=A0A852Y4P9_9MICO|nr:substrate-binding domain-containing protein [Schumannella luteola]NYG97896.1 DNA-binding LacI/PurR family transcriptional regulator [Schumannella luteola]TPX03039.1 LacI family transcriptional regulator [Schumannella luteola]
MSETATGGASGRDARIRLSDVAARAGVSNSTASLVLNGSGPASASTRQRVLDAAAELGYAGPDPRARGLRQGRSGIVAVVTEDALGDAFRDPINLAQLDGLADGLGDGGPSLLIIPGAADDPARVSSSPFDAAVLVGCGVGILDTLELLRRRRVPVIGLEAPHADGVAAIDLDNVEGARALAEHLRELGHHRVGIVTLPLGSRRTSGPLTPELEAAATAPSTSERLDGVRQVFPDAPGWIASASSIAAGYEAGAALLDGRGAEGVTDADGATLADDATGADGAKAASTRPTAILAQSDLIAIGVIRAAEERGLRVPDDLSVTGFDGIRVDGLTDHDLTTMVQPARAKGEAAGRAVLAALADPEAPAPDPVLFRTTLHRGATTARAGA